MNDKARLKAALSVLARLPNDIGKLAGDLGYSPRPGSPGAVEVRHFSDQDAVGFAHVQGALALASATDHLTALRRVCSKRATVFAPWTVARGALEASALAQWLLDPVIAVDERVERSMSLRLRSMQEERKLTEATGNGSASAHLTDGINSLRDTAAARGTRIKLDRKGRLIGFGAGMPDRVDLISTVLRPVTAADYRLLSGVAHGYPFGLLNVWDGRTETPQHLEQRVEATTLAYITVGSAQWFARPLWSQAVLAGWDLKALARVLERAYSQMDLQPDTSFWRSTANIPYPPTPPPPTGRGR